MKILKTHSFFDFKKTIAAELLKECEKPWEALPRIKDFILKTGPTLDKAVYEEIKPSVWVAKSAKISPSAVILAPTIIGEESEIRPSAYIRGGVIVGKNAVVGNSSEVKNAILFDSVQVPHFNYIGDSILGYKAHFGAGAITSNVKSDKTEITISSGGEKKPTGLKKFGAVVGDFVEVGCNAVLCPGTVIGKNTTIYPLSLVRVAVAENRIFKSFNNIIPKD